MKLPKWVLDYLAAYAGAQSGLAQKIAELADKIDAPTEWRVALGIWLSENTTLSPERILAFVALVYAEIRSGEPGYWQNAGLSA